MERFPAHLIFLCAMIQFTLYSLLLWMCAVLSFPFHGFHVYGCERMWANVQGFIFKNMFRNVSQFMWSWKWYTYTPKLNRSLWSPVSFFLLARASVYWIQSSALPCPSVLHLMVHTHLELTMLLLAHFNQSRADDSDPTHTHTYTHHWPICWAK